MDLGDRFQSVAPSLSVGGEDAANLVSHPPEHRELLLVGAGCMGGIVERPVVTIDLSGKYRTRLIGVSANRDDRVDRAIEELAQMLRAVFGDIDVDFAHDLKGQRVNIACGLGAGARHLDDITSHRAKNAFGEMAAARIAGAQNKNKRFGGGHGRSLFPGDDRAFARSRVSKLWGEFL